MICAGETIAQPDKCGSGNYVTRIGKMVYSGEWNPT